MAQDDHKGPTSELDGLVGARESPPSTTIVAKTALLHMSQTLQHNLGALRIVASGRKETDHANPPTCRGVHTGPVSTIHSLASHTVLAPRPELDMFELMSIVLLLKCVCVCVMRHV